MSPSKAVAGRETTSPTFIFGRPFDFFFVTFRIFSFGLVTGGVGGLGLLEETAFWLEAAVGTVERGHLSLASSSRFVPFRLRFPLTILSAETFPFRRFPTFSCPFLTALFTVKSIADFSLAITCFRIDSFPMPLVAASVADFKALVRHSKSS